MHLSDLKLKHVSELVDMANANELEGANRLRKQELVFALLKNQAKKGEAIYGDGTLEVLQDGFGFLRSPDTSYLAGPDDIYVSHSQIRRFNLHTGDSIIGEIRTPKDGERYFALVKVDTVNGEPPENAKTKILFENLTPLHPDEPMQLERDIKAEENLTGRILDIIAPIGKGQRGLIVAQPRTGKTMLLQGIAKAVLANHPDVVVMVLLVDERPEEVTDFRMTIGKSAEIFASSNDNPYRRHIEVTEQVLDKAKRLVLEKRDVLLLSDSLTRMTRAYNNELSSRGRTMSGGIDSRAFLMPRAFFGSARKLEEGGSLTIVGTVLVETGSRMDDIIFEEVKGTGNMELHLTRELADRRIFPAIDILESGTRREELLYTEAELKKVHLLRRALSGTKPVQAMEAMLERLRLTATNAEFLKSLGA